MHGNVWNLRYAERNGGYVMKNTGKTVYAALIVVIVVLMVAGKKL